MRRKLTHLLLLCLLVGCSGEVKNPIRTYNFERTLPNIEGVIAIGRTIAENHDMEFAEADSEELQKEFEIIFEASEGSWIYRKIGVGKSSGNSFLITLAPSSMRLHIYDQKDKIKLKGFLLEFEGLLQASKIEFTLEPIGLDSTVQSKDKSLALE